MADLEPDNTAVLAMTPYKMSRKGKRIANAQEADWGLPTINGALIGKQVANWIADRHFGPRD